MVSVPGPSLWYRFAARKMRAGGEGKEGKRVSSYFLLSLPSFLRLLQMIRGRMGSCKRRLGTSQPPQSYNFWAGKLKSYLILKKCWRTSNLVPRDEVGRTSWVGSSTDEVVISLQEIFDQLPGGYSGFQVTGMIEGFFWVWNFSISGFFGGTQKNTCQNVPSLI